MVTLTFFYRETSGTPHKMTSEAVPNQNQAESSAIAAARPPATLRLPVFSSSEPELWLLQVQFAFEAAGIDTDLTRFRILAANLPTEVARDVKDQLTASAPSYANLTKALKDRIAESRAERLQKLESCNIRRPLSPGQE